MEEVIFFQITVDCLKNNTLMIDFYNLGKKIIEEGYSLVFKGYDGTPTTIQSVAHLGSYITNITGFKHV